MRQRKTTVALAATVVGATVCLLFVAEPMSVPSASMAPTVDAGDHVIVDKLTIRLSSVRRGQLVVVVRPGSDELLVKRAVATGGDEVGIDDGVLVVNGHPVVEPYVDLSRVDGLYFGPVRVPDGSIFVLGDNRADSVDSRTFGAVPVADIVGVVSVRLWPPTWLR